MIVPVPRKSLLDRFELLVARAVMKLSHETLVRLSGTPPVVVDGQTLHPEIQFALAARKRRGVPPLRAATAELARAAMLAESRRYAREPLPLVTRDLTIAAPHGHVLDARFYETPEPGGPQPLLVFFHGGGFCLGDIETHDEPCRLLCARAGVHVLSVAYRLAPEHPFPAATEDGEAAFTWALAHAGELGADPARVGVGGDSAGGNIAAVVSHLGRTTGRTPAFQFLVYPVMDRASPWPSFDLFAKGFLLERADVDFFDGCYTGTNRELASDVRVSPLRADAPPAVPTVVVTAAFDPLRDEGEAYAAWLEKHGMPVVARRFAGMIHGFIHMAPVSRAADAAVSELASLLRQLSRTPRS
ncbi:MAG TPA: alpha/beta hydrolase [Polyangiaceae bacterium]|nr:alpha/beta hydrolase [Polyangiaceae bacterium]